MISLDLDNKMIQKPEDIIIKEWKDIYIISDEASFFNGFISEKQISIGNTL